MAESVRLVLPLPPSVNHLYRRYRGRVVLVPEAREYKAIVAAMVGSRRLSGQREIALFVWWHWPDRRVRDADNGLKLLQDALAEALGVDDRLVRHLSVERAGVDRARPRVEVEVLEL